MKALSRLQSSIICQAVESEAVASKFTTRARTYVAFGALVATALMAQGAHAQQGPISPGNCAAVGATVGGVGGSQYGNTSAKNAIGAAIGALGGAAVGYWLCDPSPARSKDSSYNQAANYGSGNGGDVIERQSPKQALSFSERERLDEMSRKAIDAKYAWKASVWDVEQARQHNKAGMTSALERESQARADFERSRHSFATTVGRLNTGANGEAPRAVGRYIEVSAALLDLSTDRGVTFQQLESRDRQLQDQSPSYLQEAQRASRMRNRG